LCPEGRLAGPPRERFDGHVEVVEGDGTSMPFGDGRFTAAACFTMLHHVPSPEAQDRLFREIRRVLAPGAPFVGTDSTGRGLGFALLHIGDTKVVIDPAGLPERLEDAGFSDVRVDSGRDAFRFRALAALQSVPNTRSPASPRPGRM
jgi:SAM-dependent methyltransferase